MNDIIVQGTVGPIVPEMDVEIVERKGLGHPDTICDAVMEQIAQDLSRFYLEQLGRLSHFNCDKGLLVAGRAEHVFGGGRILEPMRLVIGDRAAFRANSRQLNVAEIAVESAKGWFRQHLPPIDPDKDLTYQVELKPGSEELSRLFRESKTVLGANDTSAAVGYAPLSETERMVLRTEQWLNSPAIKDRFPEIGYDVKVMAVRRKRTLDLTVAVPLIDRYVRDEPDYFLRKEAVHEALFAHLQGLLEQLESVSLQINPLDRPGMGLSGIYLSVLGTSAEDADSGEVGRGNQVNGLIALNRPRGSEAAAGKNPVSHVGKIYNLLTHLLAQHIHAQIPGLRGVEVWLCSRIGEPIDRPQIVSVLLHPDPGVEIESMAGPIRELIRAQLARMPEFCLELIQGKYPVC